MATGVRRGRVGAVLIAVVLTALALWIVAVTADILLLLFLAVLLALYLGAVRDYIVRRLRLPSLLAFWIAVIGTLAATVGLMWLLVPPVLEQTRGLIATVPGQLQIWDAWVTQALAQMPGMSDVVAKLGPHALTGQIYGFLSDRLPSLFGDV